MIVNSGAFNENCFQVTSKAKNCTIAKEKVINDIKSHFDGIGRAGALHGSASLPPICTLQYLTVAVDPSAPLLLINVHSLT